MTLTAGELFAGYGGLGMAVEEVFGAELAWVSEWEEAPSKILAHHWPDVPNHGDITKIDWSAIEPVDIISGGSPCQDISGAGNRRGMTEGTRSNLWAQMREAIATIRPSYVVWENVRGAFSAEASCSLEQCPGCVGDTSDGRVFLRALGRVLGDLSDLGYDCQWRGLRASDVGACHGRFRVFVLAKNSDVSTRREWRHPAPGQAEGWRAWTDARGRGRDGKKLYCQSKEDAADWDPRREHADGHTTANTSRIRRDRRQDLEGERRDETIRSEAVNHSRYCDSSRFDTATYSSGATFGQLPAGASEKEAGPRGGHGPGDNYGEQHAVNWGPYESAIRRWERTIDRRAPRPTEPTGRDGAERLSPRFTEWMMGLPDGWVTAPVIGITRNEQLKACGNGVVPQQAIAALWDMKEAFEKSLEFAA